MKRVTFVLCIEEDLCRHDAASGRKANRGNSMQLKADTAWFTLQLNGSTDFQVYSFTGRESVSRPYDSPWSWSTLLLPKI